MKKKHISCDGLLQKLTNHIQLFQILTNHHRVSLPKKKTSLSEKTQAVDCIAFYLKENKLNIII